MNNVISYNRIPYQLVRRVSKSNFYSKGEIKTDKMNKYKELLCCDFIIEDNLYMYFCSSISELEFEEISN
jgi:hypothetical protein